MAETQAGGRCVHFALAEIELRTDQLEYLRQHAANENVELQFTNRTDNENLIKIGRIDLHAYTLNSLDRITNLIKDQLSQSRLRDAPTLDADLATAGVTHDFARSRSATLSTIDAKPESIEMQPVYTLTPEKQHSGLFGKLLRH